MALEISRGRWGKTTPSNPLAIGHWEIKGQSRKRVCECTLVPVFRSGGTSERTLVPVFRSGGTSAKTTLLETTL